MIISYSKQFIFFRPMKVAGTSVEKVLWDFCDKEVDLVTMKGCKFNLKGTLYNHIGLPLFLSKLPICLSKGIENLEDFKQNFCKITICRNPWDLQVSSFWQIMAIEKRYKGLTKQAIQDRYLQDFQNLMIALVEAPVNAAAQAKIAKGFYFYENNQPFFDVALRFEHLQEDFDALCNRLNVPKVELPFLNTQSRLIQHPYQQYYTPHTRELINKAFHQVIDHFGYRFD